MRKLIILMPALLLLGSAAFLAAPGDPPVAPAAPDPAPDVATAPAVVPAVPAAAPDEPTPAPAADAARKSMAVGELLSLLAALDESVRLRPGAKPDGTLAKLAALLEKHPDAVDRLVTEIPSLSAGVRTWLRHAIVLIGDRRVRLRLKAAVAAADPGGERIERALADPVSVVHALESLEDAADRRHLVNRLTAKHVADPGIATKLRDLARNDADAKVRGVAVFRLGRLGGPDGLEFALEILADTTQLPAARRNAAFAVRYRTDDAVQDAFLALVRRGQDSADVLSHAIRALVPAVGRAEVDAVLFALLKDRDRAARLRRHSARTIAEGAEKVKGADRTRIEEDAYAALLDLENEPGAEALYTFARGEFVSSLGREFRQRIEADAPTQATVTHEGP
jgi:hypothetical protein